jgi:hypothetical protein
VGQVVDTVYHQQEVKGRRSGELESSTNVAFLWKRELNIFDVQRRNFY